MTSHQNQYTIMKQSSVLSMLPSILKPPNITHQTIAQLNSMLQLQQKHLNQQQALCKQSQIVQDIISPSQYQEYRRLKHELNQLQHEQEITQTLLEAQEALEHLEALLQSEVNKEPVDCLSIVHVYREEFINLRKVLHPMNPLFKQKQIAISFQQHCFSIIQGFHQLANRAILGEATIASILSANGLPIGSKENQKFKVSDKDRLKLMGLLCGDYFEDKMKRYLWGLCGRGEKSELSKGGRHLMGWYYQELRKNIEYLFMDEASQMHNLQEPVWLFDYLLAVLRNNSQAIQSMTEGIYMELHGHFLQVSLEQLVGECVGKRLMVDIVTLTKQPYLMFNFLDELSLLQNNIEASYGIQIGIMERIMQQNESKWKILQVNFRYEQEWIQNKIFNEFYNINYSNINLKNIQAYNILNNFITLFDRLISKFKNITNQILLSTINNFYSNSIKKFIAHIKTSFERVYTHSGHPKLDILVAFKRLQNQFKSHFLNYAHTVEGLYQFIVTQYFDHYNQYLRVYALQELTPVHKKIIKQVTQHDNVFANEDYNAQQQQAIMQEFIKIHRKWVKKLEQLQRVSRYVDNKLKSIFFLCLKATVFTMRGISLYLGLFEEFMKVIYTHQQWATIKRLTLTDTVGRISFTKHNAAMLKFLEPNQIEAICQCKILAE